MGAVEEGPSEVLHAELAASFENLLRFIRLEFQMAETLASLLMQTENRRQRKRIWTDIRKAKGSIVRFKKRLGTKDSLPEVDGHLQKIDVFLSQSGSPSTAKVIIRKLRHRIRKIKIGARRQGR
jgi:hypothetical protein